MESVDFYIRSIFHFPIISFIHSFYMSNVLMKIDFFSPKFIQTLKGLCAFSVQYSRNIAIRKSFSDDYGRNDKM